MSIEFHFDTFNPENIPENLDAIIVPCGDNPMYLSYWSIRFDNYDDDGYIEKILEIIQRGIKQTAIEANLKHEFYGYITKGEYTTYIERYEAALDFICFEIDDTESRQYLYEVVSNAFCEELEENEDD